MKALLHLGLVIGFVVSGWPGSPVLANAPFSPEVAQRESSNLVLGHNPTDNLGYTNGTHFTSYTAFPNMRQGNSSIGQAKSTIAACDATDLYVNFTFDTSGKSIYLVYTTNGTAPTQTNGVVVTAIFSNYIDPDRTWVAQIPANANTAGGEVRYVFYISDGDLALAWGRVAADGYQTSWTEGSSYFPYTVAYGTTGGGGNWNAAGSWQGGSVPNSSSVDVEICAGASVTADTAASVRTLKINAGGTLVGQSGVTLDLYGDWINNGTFTANNNIITLNGTVAQAIGGANATTFAWLTLANAAGVTLNQPIMVINDWTNNGAFTANGNTVTFNGASAQTIGGSQRTTFATLLLDNASAGGVTQSQPVTITNNFIITGTTHFTDGGVGLDFTGTASAGNVLTVHTTAYFTATGPVNFYGQGNTHNSRVVGGGSATLAEVNLYTNGAGFFGVDFYDQSIGRAATLTGILTLNTGTFVAHAEVGSAGGCDPVGCQDIDASGSPIYADGSTLRYNTGAGLAGAFSAKAEWARGQTGGERGVPYNVIIANGTWVDLGANAGNRLLRNALTINSGGTLTTTNNHAQCNTCNGLSLGVAPASTLVVSGTVINDGVISQTQTVLNNTPTNFGFIQNTAGTTTAYYGVVITPTSGDMQSTSVLIFGNRQCGTQGTLPQTVKRCYEIDPTTAQTANLAFYFRDAEANGNGANPPTKAWHWNSTSRLWDEVGTGTTNGGSDNGKFVGTTGWGGGYSPFALKDSNAPTAIELKFLAARTVGVEGPLALAALLLLMVALLRAWVRRPLRR